MNTHNIDQFIALETTIAEALISGDIDVDAKHLTDDFLGVYDSGFAGKEDHTGQLDDGPTFNSFEISDARLMTLTDNTVLLSYLATYTRTISETKIERMYVSSIWQQRGEKWLNVFSQDTPTQ